MAGRLDALDLTLRLSRAKEAERLAAAPRPGWSGCGCPSAARSARGSRAVGPPLCVVFEGWDASGKGGCIKRLTAPLDPRHVRVASFAAPTHDEKRHHFLWRFWPALPGWGGMAVLDRSWYGRVLVERVEGFATEEQWRRAYDEIVEFERTLVAEGMIMVKFWMHVSEEEQLKRFERRARRPAQAVEAHRRGLAQPGEAAGVRGRGRGDAGPDRHAAGALVPGRGRQQAVGPGQGGGDGRARRSKTGCASAACTSRSRRPASSPSCTPERRRGPAPAAQSAQPHQANSSGLVVCSFTTAPSDRYEPAGRSA